MDQNIIKDFRKIEAALNEVRSEQASLEEKRAATEGKLFKLQEEFKGAEAVKNQVLIDHALGKCSERDFEQAEKACDRLTRDQKRAQDIVEVLGVRFEEVSRKIPPLEQRLRSVENSLWAGVTEKLLVDLRKLVGNKISLAFGAHRRTSTPDFFPDFLAMIWPDVDQSELDELNGEIDKLIGG